jgi:hypothetical protein
VGDKMIRFVMPSIVAVCLFSFGAKAVILSEPVKNQDGSIQLMRQQEASQFCKSIHSRLPTLAEYVEFAQNLGAKASRISFASAYPVYVKGRVQFYYDERNYQRPQGELGTNLFWTSTCLENCDSDDYGYLLNGATGSFDAIHVEHNLGYAVRCITKEL